MLYQGSILPLAIAENVSYIALMIEQLASKLTDIVRQLYIATCLSINNDHDAWGLAKGGKLRLHIIYINKVIAKAELDVVLYSYIEMLELERVLQLQPCCLASYVAINYIAS